MLLNAELKAKAISSNSSLIVNPVFFMYSDFIVVKIGGKNMYLILSSGIDAMSYLC